jgi:hypothetical protein
VSVLRECDEYNSLSLQKETDHHIKTYCTRHTHVYRHVERGKKYNLSFEVASARAAAHSARVVGCGSHVR